MEKIINGRLWSSLIILLSILFLCGASSPIGASNGGDSSAAGPYIEDELLIQPKEGVPNEKVAELLSGLGVVLAEEIPQIRVKRIRVPSHAFETVRNALSKNPHVNFVEPNFLAEPTVVPNDYWYPSQWHLSKISAPQGWDISTGSSNVTIAILDTGIDPTHPDLSAKLVPGYNFYDKNADTHDICGHGTAVAGSAAALSNNSIGVAGIAWQNPIMPLRISDTSCYATYSAIASALTYAADRGVKVMNISFAGTSSSSTLQNAVNYAWNKGAVVFASAGNYSTSTLYYPAACGNVVSVSATTSSDTLASFSNYGNWVDISAPGSLIVTTMNGGGYNYTSGTSFSSPIAAGVAALTFSANPGLTNADVVKILLENSDDLGVPGFDPYFGYGRINIYKSLLAATNATPQPDATRPVASITSPLDGSTVSGGVTINVSAADNVGVTRVDLFINGTLYASDDTGPYSFYWDTTGSPDGSYDLLSRAYDASGNIGQSNPTIVYISNPKDAIPPSVSITSPLSGSPVGKKASIQVNASDDRAVKKIELYIDGDLKAAGNSSSLAYSWNTVKVIKGQHTISSKAYDGAGNIGTSAITVYK